MVSITLGLSLTRLLDGAARLAMDSARVVLFRTHTLWVVIILMLHAAYWWSIWDYRDIEWNFARFVAVNSTPLLLFFVSALLIPRVVPVGEIDLRAHFFRIRPWLMGAAAVSYFIWMIDGPIIFGSEPALLDFASDAKLVGFRCGQLAGLSLLLWGMRSKSDRAHSVIAWTLLLGNTLLVWSRFFPDAFGPGA
jgi:hypothetical protein